MGLGWMAAMLLALFWCVVGVSLAGYILLSPGPATFPWTCLSIALIALVVILYQRFAPAALRTLRVSGVSCGIILAVVFAGIWTSCGGVEQASDFGEYLRLGKKLWADGSYDDRGMYAWRPPGMALLLAVPLGLGLPDGLVVWIVNAASLAVVGLVMQRLMAGHRVNPLGLGVIAALIVVALTPLLLVGFSEVPAMALILLSLVILPHRAEMLSATRLRSAFAAGCLTGAAALFRPLLILQFPVMMWALWISRHSDADSKRSLRRAALRIMAVFIGGATVIAPWTIRNYVALGRFVLISTNGGEVFYAANSPADAARLGRYNKDMYLKLRDEVPDEVERNAEGYRRGMQSILSHPTMFLRSLPYRAIRNIYWSNAKYMAEHSEPKLPRFLPPAMEILWLGAFGVAWIRVASQRRPILERARSPEVVPWPHMCLILLFLVMLLFEAKGRSFIELSGYIVFIWASALYESREGRPAMARDPDAFFDTSHLC